MRLKKYIVLMVFAIALPVSAQIGLPNATPVTENFNSMAATLNLPANWRMAASTAAPTWAAAATTVGQQASTGTPATGATYNFGSSTAERAVGAMTSGGFASPNNVIGWYQNTNGTFLTDLAITYNAERYRINTAAASVQFFYSLDGSTWTAVTTGDVAAASFPTGGSAYNFATGTTVPVSFSITGLSVANTGNIYLRWNINTTGANSQGIAIDDVSVTATFATACSTPTTQASTLATTAITNTGASFSWANGAATSGSMVVINPTASASVAPTSGTSYTANAAYASAGQINTNNRVIFRGGGTTGSVTGLTPATQYTATIYAYNDPGSCYNTATPETVTFYTLANEPNAQPGSFSCATSSVSQINLTFPAANTLGNAVGYIILYRIGAAPTGVPTDGAYHAPGTVFGDATVVGQTSLSGTDTTFSATGLNAGTTYYFSLVPFNSFLSVAETINYRTAATIRTTFCTTVTSPEINITGLGQTINPGNMPIGVDNTLFAAQAVSTTSGAKSYVIQNLGNANLTLTGVSPYVTLGGANPGDFAISTPAVTPVGPSSSTTFAITFTPSAPGARTATVTVGSNDVTEPTYTFNIQGSGDDREIEVYGKGISIPSGSVAISTANNTQFGNVHITAATSVKTFSIFNPGTLALTISGATISGADAADFSVTAAPASSVNANAATNLSITFNPTTVGIKNALVTIVNNDANESTYTFAIQGVGIDYIDCALGAYEIIAQQDFEASPATPVMLYATSQESGAGIITVGGGTARGSSRSVASNMFIGARSFQIPGHLANSGTEKLTTIDFATVDASAHQDVSLSFKLGAYSTNNTQGLDTTPEKVTLYISTNNGATWSQEMDFYGSNNSIWDINTSSGTATGDFDGNNITAIYQAVNNSVNSGPKTITLNNLPSASQLKVRITFSLDRLDEIWVIDDVKLQGKKDAVTTWNGSAWSNAAPTPTVKAIINGAYITAAHGNIQTCQCQVNPGFALTVSGNTYLEIQNNLINNGTVNVATSGSLVQVNNAAVNTGTIGLARDVNIRKYDYVYWSAPVNAFPVANVSSGTASNYIFKWLPQQSGNFGIWSIANENMVAGKGYIIRGPSAWPTTFSMFTANFSGAPNNGIITPTIERGSQQGANYLNNGLVVTKEDDNWNLIGNPYPSSIKALDFLNANTNIEGAVRLWTHGSLPSTAQPDPFYNNFFYNYNSNDYIVYNGTGTISGPAGFNGYIASGQGFFVLMNDGPIGSQTVTFNNAMRSRTYANSQFYRNAAHSNDATERTEGETLASRIWMDLVGPDQTVSRTLVGYVEGATLEKDRMYDAYGRLDSSQNFYSLIANEPMAIQGRPLPFDDSDIVPLGLHVMQPGNYKIAISAIDGVFGGGVSIYLEDKALGIVHDLRQAPYEFTASAGTLDARFILRYSNTALGNAQFDAADNGVVIATDNHQIAIKSYADAIQEISIYDLLGREMFHQAELNDTEFIVREVQSGNQVLAVKVKLQNGTVVTRKIML